MVIGTYILITTLNVNGLNAPTKRHTLAEWIQNQDPYICSTCRCISDVFVGRKVISTSYSSTILKLLQNFTREETQKKKKTYSNKHKTIKKMVIGTYISIITLL